jgi:polar amino acid transport system substrate-binding protein
MKTRHFLYLTAATLCGPVALANDAALLRVGMELTYPPFEMQNAEGQPDGVSVRLAEALSAALGRPLKIVPMSFSGLIPALKSGEIDLIISSLTETEERRRSIDFSDPYAGIALAILTHISSSVKAAADLNQAKCKIAVKSATSAETWVIKNCPDAQRISFEDEAACLAEVKSGRADAFIYDQLTVIRYHQKNQTTTRALLQPLSEESWAIGLKKGQSALKSSINDFLKKYRADGGFEKLGEKYLKDEKEILRQAGIPFVLR